jgi:hypothetical protein
MNYKLSSNPVTRYYQLHSLYVCCHLRKIFSQETKTVLTLIYRNVFIQ